MGLSHEQIEKIRRLAEEVALREGCKLYDIEFSGGPNRTLRVFIERTDPSSQDGQTFVGVSLDDCVNVSRGLSLLLDVEDPIPGGRYELEVSSPGLERKLTQLWHFERASGEKVRLSYMTETGSQSLEGVIKGVQGSTVTIENNKGSFDIEFNEIQKAKQLFAQPEKGKKR